MYIIMGICQSSIEQPIIEEKVNVPEKESENVPEKESENVPEKESENGLTLTHPSEVSLDTQDSQDTPKILQPPTPPDNTPKKDLLELNTQKFCTLIKTLKGPDGKRKYTDLKDIKKPDMKEVLTAIRSSGAEWVNLKIEDVVFVIRMLKCTQLATVANGNTEDNKVYTAEEIYNKHVELGLYKE